jgi:hypothetical protein
MQRPENTEAAATPATPWSPAIRTKFAKPLINLPLAAGTLDHQSPLPYAAKRIM